METERAKIEDERLAAEQQYEAPSYVDNDGKILYNAKIESTLSEFHIGRLANQIYWDMKPEQQADAQEVFASKAITNYFLEKEWYYRELSMRDHSKSIYWLGIWDMWLHLEIETKYKPKEWAEAEQTDVSWGVDDDKLFEEYKQYNRFFTPKNVNPRHFYRDDRQFRQPDWEKVEDCFKVEFISKAKLEERRWDNPDYDISWLEPTTHTDKAWVTYNDSIKIYYYDNKNNKDHIILGNEEHLIRHTKNKYKNGKLPYNVCQHYPNNKCIAWRGIPYKVRASKWYINNMTQSALDKSWSSAFSNIVLGKNNMLNDRYTLGGGVNIWEMNSSSDFEQFQSSWDLNGVVAMIEMMHDNIRQDTGEDPRAPFESPEQTLWQTEIVEENKSIRLKAIQIARDISLDESLTFTYNNIQQFAPILLRKTEVIEHDDGKKTTKVIRPVIWLPWIKVKKEKGKQILEETKDYGEAWWYELNPKYRMIDWVVKVVTNSTYNKAWSVLEKNKFEKYLEGMINLAKIYWPEVLEKMPLNKVIELQNQAYWYDNDWNFAATTKKDKQREENLKALEEFKAKMWWENLLPTKKPDENSQLQINPVQQIQWVSPKGGEIGGGEETTSEGLE